MNNLPVNYASTVREVLALAAYARISYKDGNLEKARKNISQAYQEVNFYESVVKSSDSMKGLKEHLQRLESLVNDNWRRLQ